MFSSTVGGGGRSHLSMKGIGFEGFVFALAVEGRDELASVEFLRFGKDGDCQLRHEVLGGCVHEWTIFDRVDGASEHSVDLDFDHRGTLIDQQFGIAHFLVSHFARGESGFFETPGNDLETCRDFLQGRLPRGRVVHIDEIEINRETGHFTDEEVDGRASFEREGGSFENIRSNAEHQLHGLYVGLIHF